MPSQTTEAPPLFSGNRAGRQSPIGDLEERAFSVRYVPTLEKFIIGTYLHFYLRSRNQSTRRPSSQEIWMRRLESLERNLTSVAKKISSNRHDDDDRSKQQHRRYDGYLFIIDQYIY